MLANISTILLILLAIVVVCLLVVSTKIRFLSSKITFTILGGFLILMGILFFNVVYKVGSDKPYTVSPQTPLEHPSKGMQPPKILPDNINNINDTENYKRKTTINVGAVGNFTPWSYMSNNRITGFNIDVARAAVTLMGKKIRIIIYPNIEQLYQALDAHEIDIIINLETKDYNQQNKYAYSISLVDLPLVFVASKKIGRRLEHDELTLRRTLQNKTIAVPNILFLKNSVSQYIDNSSGVAVLNNNNNMLSAVSKGQYHIGFTEYYSFLYYKYHNPQTNLMIIGPLLRNEQQKAQSFVMNTEDVELRNQLNIALNVLKRRGDISNFSIKYFQEDVTL